MGRKHLGCLSGEKGHRQQPSGIRARPLSFPARGLAPDETRGRPQEPSESVLLAPQVPLPHCPARSAFMKLLLRAGIRDDLDAFSAPRHQFNRLGHFAGPGAPQRGEQASGAMKAPDGTQPRGESPLKFSGSKNNPPHHHHPSPARTGSALLRNWKFILTAENGPWKAS